MIKCLRWKFIMIMMAIVTVLLTITFGMLYYTTKTNFYRHSMGALHKGMMANTPAGRISSPPQRDIIPLLIVDITEEGVLHIVKNKLPNIDGADIRDLINLAADKPQDTGTLSQKHLRFLSKTQPDGAIRYVFADIYQEQIALYWQIINSLLIGLGSLLMFFVLSFYLSGWSIKPVATAWNQQQQFVADASHELKTPLTVILANTNMLVNSPDIPDGKDRQRIQYILEEARRMKRLTERLLTLARGDCYQGSTPYTDLDFSYLVSRCLMTVEANFFDLGKHLACDVDDGIVVYGNNTELCQMVHILLDNACKYSSANSTIQIGLHKKGVKDAILTVTNEGTPLIKEDIKHIFDRFYRANPSRSGIPGHGLGLSIALNIIRKHKGEIRAVSDGISQNTFSVRIPLYICTPRRYRFNHSSLRQHLEKHTKNSPTS